MASRAAQPRGSRRELFDRAVLWLIGGRVLLPGITTLAPLITSVRAEQLAAINDHPVEQTPLEMRRELLGTLVVSEGKKVSPLEWMRAAVAKGVGDGGEGGAGPVVGSVGIRCGGGGRRRHRAVPAGDGARPGRGRRHAAGAPVARAADQVGTPRARLPQEQAVSAHRAEEEDAARIGRRDPPGGGPRRDERPCCARPREMSPSRRQPNSGRPQSRRRECRRLGRRTDRAAAGLCDGRYGRGGQRNGSAQRTGKIISHAAMTPGDDRGLENQAS